MGTGTLGGRQGRILGIQGLADLLHFGYDNGLIFWDAADSYGSHPHLKEALKRVPREKVTIMTKSSPARPTGCARTWTASAANWEPTTSTSC